MKKIKHSIIGLCSFIALFSCEKDDSNLGSDVGGDQGKVNASLVDTFKVVTYSEMEDSVLNYRKTNQFLGAYISDEVGLAKSTLFATLEPNQFGTEFPTDSFAIDSFYLQLDLIDFYGKNINQKFEVYRLDATVHSDSVYYAHHTLPYTDLMGTFTINETDSGTYKFDLDSAYGAELLKASSADLASQSTFTEFFKGVAIVPKSGDVSTNDGQLYTVPGSKVELHLDYHTINVIEPTAAFDTSVVFSIIRDTMAFSNFSHDITGSDVEAVINDSTLGQNFFYMQGLMGPLGKIKFPTVQNWYDGPNGYLINKFELKFYVEDNSTFTLPNTVWLSYNNTIGTKYIKEGTLNTSDLSYSIFISADEVDAKLKDKTFDEMDFTIRMSLPSLQGNQVKIYGGESAKPPVLTVHYTKY